MNFSIQDGKMKILMQRNELTDMFRQNERLIFDNDRNSIYEIVDLSSVTTPGMRRLILNKTEYKRGYDDLANNIAWNRFIEEGSDTIEYDLVSSSGKFEVFKSSTVTFSAISKSLENTSDWNITVENLEQDWCEIIENTNDSITIKNVKGYMKAPIVLVFTSTLDNTYILKQEVRLKNY